MKTQPQNHNLSLHDLHGVLSDQIRGLVGGTTTAAAANAVTNACGKVVSIVKLHLEYAKMTGQPIPSDPFALPKSRIAAPKEAGAVIKTGRGQVNSIS